MTTTTPDGGAGTGGAGAAAAAARNPNKRARGAPRKERAPLAEPVAAASPGDSKFARALGSPDYVTRERGLSALLAWMSVRTDLTEADMLKIWKGLFFCFWHSDKAPVQVRALPL